MQFTIATDKSELEKSLAPLRADAQTIALVPTMGALHEGHLSLVRLAREHASCVAVSIFVNPKQFGPKEDFARYPRTLESDIVLLKEAGAHVLYAPSVETVYPHGFATHISVAGVSEGLCGASRPGHFDGVATVVAKLLLAVRPHVAVFGEKDYQQLCVIRRMVDDLEIGVEIIGAPIMREPDGLAMSSRNRYLTPQEREIAPRLYQIMQRTQERIRAGMAIALALAEGKQELIQSGFALDYLELCAQNTLHPLSVLCGPARLLAAVYLGQTRLIDNCEIDNE